MFRLVSGAVVAIALLLAGLAAGLPGTLLRLARQPPDDPAVAKAPAPRPKVILGPRFYWGHVTALTRDAIDIATPEDIVKQSPNEPGGKVIEFAIPAQPPKRFPLSDFLKAGGALKTSDGPLFVSYRLADVRVGDRVKIVYHPDPVLGDTCHMIGIERRPGGLVPPAFDDGGKNPPWQWHNWCNASQRYEAEGIPYNYKAWQARFREDHIAPPPKPLFPEVAPPPSAPSIPPSKD